MSLTPRQKRFCNEYLKDLNGTQAAIRAGYSKKTANRIATENLSKPVIKEEILKAMEKREKRTEITQDKVLKELALVGFSDFADYGEIEKGIGLQIKSFDEIKEGKTRAIKSINERQDSKSISISFKLHDKIKALELLGKHLGMFKEQIEHSGEIKLLKFDFGDNGE